MVLYPSCSIGYYTLATQLHCKITCMHAGLVTSVGIQFGSELASFPGFLAPHSSSGESLGTRLGQSHTCIRRDSLSIQVASFKRFLIL